MSATTPRTPLSSHPWQTQKDHANPRVSKNPAAVSMRCLNSRGLATGAVSTAELNIEYWTPDDATETPASARISPDGFALANAASVACRLSSIASKPGIASITPDHGTARQRGMRALLLAENYADGQVVAVAALLGHIESQLLEHFALAVRQLLIGFRKRGSNFVFRAQVRQHRNLPDKARLHGVHGLGEYLVGINDAVGHQLVQNRLVVLAKHLQVFLHAFRLDLDHVDVLDRRGARRSGALTCLPSAQNVIGMRRHVAHRNQDPNDDGIALHEPVDGVVRLGQRGEIRHVGPENNVVLV